MIRNSSIQLLILESLLLFDFFFIYVLLHLIKCMFVNFFVSQIWWHHNPIQKVLSYDFLILDEEKFDLANYKLRH